MLKMGVKDGSNELQRIKNLFQAKEKSVNLYSQGLRILCGG